MSTTIPVYQPLLSDLPTITPPARRRNLIYAIAVVLLISCIGLLAYFVFVPNKMTHPAITIVNRRTGDIEVFQIFSDGCERFAGRLSTGDVVAVYASVAGGYIVRNAVDESVLLYSVGEKHPTHIEIHDGEHETNDKPLDLVASTEGPPTDVMFCNRERHDVVLSWVDFDGKAKALERIRIGRSVNISTFVNHVFTMTDAFSKKLIVQVTIHPKTKYIGTRGVEDAAETIQVSAETQTDRS
uniref:von Hippel-Lindau disease tumour suppressor beta domain-containing protein n=1 Tax=Spongospora subterranea TaxID=70186 RepID=A0A0H5RBQ0_9EUKA|eukprot:CRZ11042.1 hypothetical protein [Spongospora subterranea]